MDRMFREKPWIDPSQSNPHFSACIRVPRQKLYIANSGQVLDTKLRAKYSDTGSSTGAVNFPEVELPILQDSHRIMNIHRNVPGVLRDITRIIADMGGDINAQYLSTRHDIECLIMDIDHRVSLRAKQSIEELETSIRTRVLF